MSNLNLFIEGISNFIPEERIYTDDIRKAAYAGDASAYSLLPQCVVVVSSEPEAQMVIGLCHKLDIPVTFRGAGTSLSGQGVTDSVLMVTSRSWNKYLLSENKKTITLEPSAIAGKVNNFLKQYNLKIGPDPASIDNATIGGIAANNSSGMTSGVENNCYNTLESLRVILPDGSLLDTSNDYSRKEFIRMNRHIIKGIKELTNTINSDDFLKNKITGKYKIKNTCGYGVNSFVDFNDPVDIISRLMIGSEGTLGFISEITLRTVKANPVKATAFIVFPDILSACKSLDLFDEKTVDAAELMNNTALKKIQSTKNTRYIKKLTNDSTAILIEISAESGAAVDKLISRIKKELAKIHVKEVEFIKDPAEQKTVWDLRKGLFPALCKEREPGTTVIIEDLNFHPRDLSTAVLAIESLFKKFKYPQPVIWGHALSGNIHFVLSRNFTLPGEIKKYKFFMEDLTDLVINKFNGSLKAEHGTGRNIAPFVEFEWGSKIYSVMEQIKTLFDKKRILNPDVIISHDKEIHLKHLKSIPVTDSDIDKCIECGFCENICPSKNVTLTPRQRIAVWRKIKQLENSGQEIHLKKNLLKSYNYYGIDTCAVDGLCSLDCPVDIDTGQFIKEIKCSRLSPLSKSLAETVSSNFGVVSDLFANSLSILDKSGRILSVPVLRNTTRLLKKISRNNIPEWNSGVPGKAEAAYISEVATKKSVVYFPSCVSRTMGPGVSSNETMSQQDVVRSLLKKAGYTILYPENINNLCCGQPFESKGYFNLADRKSEDLYQALYSVSRGGIFPVLFDTSPCSLRMKKYIQENKNSSINIFDSVEFIESFIIKQLKITQKYDKIALHITCSTKKMFLGEKLKDLARLCAKEVVIPEDISCCGFSGDKGFKFPELNRSALKELKIKINGCGTGISTSRTCEIGLTQHSGIEYKSIFYLINECAGEAAASPDLNV